MYLKTEILKYRYACAHMSLGPQFSLSPGCSQCSSQMEHSLCSNPAVMFQASAGIPIILFVCPKNAPYLSVLLKTTALAGHRVAVQNPSTQEAESGGSGIQIRLGYMQTLLQKGGRS